MSDQSQFSIGDKVKLKSGGPAMVIVGPGSGIPGALLCAWFNDKGEPRERSYPPRALETAPEPDRRSMDEILADARDGRE